MRLQDISRRREVKADAATPNPEWMATKRRNQNEPESCSFAPIGFVFFMLSWLLCRIQGVCSVEVGHAEDGCGDCSQRIAVERLGFVAVNQAFAGGNWGHTNPNQSMLRQVGSLV